MRQPMTIRSLVGALALTVAAVETAPGQGAAFRSVGEAESAAARIMDASGLRRVDFEFLVLPGDNNARATITVSPGGGARRVITYDPAFLLNIERQTDHWGPVSIMAHEVAHHLLGHTVFKSDREAELDADYFSGFILRRLGADLDQAQAAMRTLGSAAGSASHPSRRRRLEFIAMGWRKAGEGLAGGADEALAELRAELRELEGRLRGAETEVERTQAERDAALDELRRLQAAAGGTADDRVRAAEAQVRETEDRLRAAEAEREAAVGQLDQFRMGAAGAAETADRALLLTLLLVPLVLASLLLALRRPRREIFRVVERAATRLGRPPAGGGGSGGSGTASRRPSDAPVLVFAGAAGEMPVRDVGLAQRDGGCVIGRNPELVDVVVDDQTVSWRHARLTRDGRAFYVEDLNSSNGTRVNGAALDPFVPRAIAHGDAVQFGDAALSVRPARS